MLRKIIMLLTVLTLSGCTSLRSVGNSETYFLEPAECGCNGCVERDDTCYQQTIVGLKADGRASLERPDGTKIEVDNGGQPSFAHDLATAVQAIAIQKAVNDD